MMITTLIDGVHGETDESELIREDGVFENNHEKTTWVEYRRKTHPGEAPVHRSVHVTIKEGVSLFPTVGGF